MLVFEIEGIFLSWSLLKQHEGYSLKCYEWYKYNDIKDKEIRINKSSKLSFLSNMFQ